MKTALKCQFCHKGVEIEVPKATRIVMVIDGLCKHCGKVNHFRYNPPRLKQFELKGKGLELLGILRETFNKKYKQDFSLEETLGVLFMELEDTIKQSAKDAGIKV